VPAEHVASIREGAVELDLDRPAFDRLERYQPPQA
jgi:hypothetical protein